MLMMSVGNALWLTGVVAEVSVLAILLYKRAWRTFPFFFAFCIWEPLSDGGSFVVLHYFSDSYPVLYLFDSIVEALLEFSVLVEIAWSVLRPMRNALPRQTLLVIILLVMALGAAVWPFSGLHLVGGLFPIHRNIVHVQQTAAILRIFFFLVLAAGSQLLAIGWRDRELQIATGLGFYSLISLFTAMTHTREAATSMYQYIYLNYFAAASYLCSLLYWAFCFLQKEAPRREFTPQMQSLLLAVAGVARADRSALNSPSSSRRSNKP
jgi:hypothetical protein